MAPELLEIAQSGKGVSSAKDPPSMRGGDAADDVSDDERWKLMESRMRSKIQEVQ